jgi:hypothetical protein
MIVIPFRNQHLYTAREITKLLTAVDLRLDLQPAENTQESNAPPVALVSSIFPPVVGNYVW